MARHPIFYFVSQNKFKAEEVEELGKAAGFDVVHIDRKLDELQVSDIDKLIRHKAREAFRELMLPVLVDHAGLHLDCLGGMPGSLTQLFWDTLKDQICDIARLTGRQKAAATCAAAVCDGRRIHVFEGRIEGSISDAPRGSREFQWDTIFIPDGLTKAYGEMTATEKNVTSQRRLAFEKLFAFLASAA